MSAILERAPLGFQWPTLDPFLFCVHHNDAYPAGTATFGPEPSTLKGRDMGQDFAGIDGWRMYHGSVVPGFPPHPHRGFETVTITREGMIDHSDSLGAAARFGDGDVQWLTAGKGIVHSEMFPLLRRDQGNPAELFQIWLNLPRRHKMVDPYFAMFWNNDIPVHRVTNAEGRKAEVTVVAGAFGDASALPPPPNSWAANRANNLGIWTIKMEPGAELVLPKLTNTNAHRMVYFFLGSSITLAGEKVSRHEALLVDGSRDLKLLNGDTAAELLVLQGAPIAEPVVSHGPFVMNERHEIQQAMNDYRATQFGGWPWPTDEPVHGTDAQRFARYPDGRVSKPT